MDELVAHWVDSWNRGDVEAVLTHFAEDVIFVSPKAAALAGSARIEGKAALRAYWTTARAKLSRIHFTLDHFVWDERRRTLAIVCDAELGERRNRAIELLTLGADGLAHAGEAFYGA